MFLNTKSGSDKHNDEKLRFVFALDKLRDSRSSLEQVWIQFALKDSNGQIWDKKKEKKHGWLQVKIKPGSKIVERMRLRTRFGQRFCYLSTCSLLIFLCISRKSASFFFALLLQLIMLVLLFKINAEFRGCCLHSVGC